MSMKLALQYLESLSEPPPLSKLFKINKELSKSNQTEVYNPFLIHLKGKWKHVSEF